MSLQRVRRNIVARLDEGDRGDRGWFVITRVHVALSWLKGIAEYLENRGGDGIIRLTAHDYARLATVIETENANPGRQLRRHHLLVMNKPLQLLQRVDGRRWDRVVLTGRGRALAHTNNPSDVLEESLSALRFAVEPWFPPNRVARYREFDVQVYEATRQVLRRSGGYIDRNEFDFFVSRIRTIQEITWAVDSIADYRPLLPDEKNALNTEVRDRIQGDKAYSNWRDVGLHTFALFALGTSMRREGTRLLLSSGIDQVRGLPARPEQFAAPQLRMPNPPELQELLTPPTAPASNDGADAESFVAKVLRSQGWEVAFYTNRRGYGFDLWARRENRAMVIEVKSSLGNLGAVSLTPTEFQAAEEHAESYFLALVEHMSGATPRLRMIQNPMANLAIEERLTANYVIPRASWLGAAEAAA